MTTDNPTQLENKLEPCPQDLIAFKWAETLSTGEQSVLLTSSLKRLQSMIDSRSPVVAPQADALALKKLSSRIGDVIEESLRSYRCQYTRELPDLENGLALVDLLTPEPDRDVTRGLQELELLADYIAADVDDVIKEFPAAPSPSSPVPPEALARASKLCRSTIPGARVELIFQNLQDAQAVHKWLCNLNSPAATPTPVGQEHPYFAHAKTCEQCGPSGFCTEGARLYNATPSPSLAREAANRGATEICDWCGIDSNDSERVAEIILKFCSPVPAAGGDDRPLRQCTKCEHFETVSLHDDEGCQVQGQSGFICGCRCEFASSHKGSNQ